VNQNTTAAVQPLLDEAVRRREGLEQIFIFHVVNLYHKMLEGLEELLVHR
jgi:hypothetical protein